MKLSTLRNGTPIAVQHGQYLPLSRLGFAGSLLELIQSGRTLDLAAAKPGDWLPLNPEDLGPPLPRPPKIICVGLNYRQHALESGMAIPTVPVIFTRFATTLTGPYADVPHDAALTQELDYEVELAVFIGRGGKRIPRQQALEHVYGYSVCNDISARDVQLGPDTGGQWTRGKNVDGTCPVGPWIVTRDEVPDPQALRLGCSVNGLEVQSSNTADMIFSVEDIIHRLSHWFTLEAGDLIITGTPQGVGFARQPPIFLKPGDTTRVWIDGLGHLENRIVADDLLADGVQATETAPLLQVQGG